MKTLCKISSAFKNRIPQQWRQQYMPTHTSHRRQSLHQPKQKSGIDFKIFLIQPHMVPEQHSDGYKLPAPCSWVLQTAIGRHRGVHFTESSAPGFLPVLLHQMRPVHNVQKRAVRVRLKDSRMYTRLHELSYFHRTPNCIPRMCNYSKLGKYSMFDETECVLLTPCNTQE